MFLIIPLLGLALVDSINPSALIVTIALLTIGASTANVLTYVAAIMATYFTIGCLLMLGLGTVASQAVSRIDERVVYGGQLLLGAGLLTYALAAPNPKGEARGPKLPRTLNLGSVFLLGATVTLIEAPTAFPYLAAIALMTREGLNALEWLPHLAMYNVIFIAPPLLILGSYRTFGDRARPLLDQIRDRLARGMRETLLWIVGIIGFFLTLDALNYYEFFGLITS